MEEIAKPQENKEYPDTLKDRTIPYCRKSHVLEQLTSPAETARVT